MWTGEIGFSLGKDEASSLFFSLGKTTNPGGTLTTGPSEMQRLTVDRHTAIFCVEGYDLSSMEEMLTGLSKLWMARGRGLGCRPSAPGTDDGGSMSVVWEGIGCKILCKMRAGLLQLQGLRLLRLTEDIIPGYTPHPTHHDSSQQENSLLQFKETRKFRNLRKEEVSD